MNSTAFTGLLLQSPDTFVSRDNFERCRGLKFVGELAGQWEEFELETSERLLGEDARVYPPPFRHRVLVRRSGPRFLLLANHREVIDHLVDVAFRSFFQPRVRPVPIAIDALVQGLTHRPTRYAISFAHAKVPATGALLRSISFYGEDIGQASLFRSQFQSMVFYTCGLREAKGGTEIVRLGADGSVFFYLHTNSRVLEVEKVLRFLRTEGYLSADIIADEKEKQ